MDGERRRHLACPSASYAAARRAAARASFFGYLRGDLIEAYKIITGKESIQWERFFELAPSKVSRGCRYKLFKKWKGTLGQKFFSARVVDLWNALDDSTVSVDNLTAFKRKLGKLGY